MIRSTSMRRPLVGILALATLGAAVSPLWAAAGNPSGPTLPTNDPRLIPAPLASLTNLRTYLWGGKVYLVWQDNSSAEAGNMIQAYRVDSLDLEHGTVTYSWQTIATVPANSISFSGDFGCEKVRVVAYRWAYSSGTTKVETKNSASVEAVCDDPGPTH